MDKDVSKEEMTPAAESGRDEQLFVQLGKNKKQKKRRILRTVLIVIAVLAVVLISGISILRRQVRQRFASQSVEVECYEVVSGTISTLVSGSGMLMHVDTEALTVPAGVEVTEILVDYGAAVCQGDLLALVDEASVCSALESIQSEIQSLDTQIRNAEDDQAPQYIQAGVTGRVKAIYAQQGDRVADVMAEHGALAVLSLDGYMAVEIRANDLNPEDSVQVIREDGTALEGTVASVAGSKAVILVSDDGTQPDERVEVRLPDGNALDSGTLYIHKPLAVTGYAGTVATVASRENTKVWSESPLFYLKDTAHSAHYDTLLRERGEKEETLMDLLKLRKFGGITAPIGGSVFSVADLKSEEELTDIVVLTPDNRMSVTISVDESDILALELDQKADVTVSAVSEDVLAGVVTEIDKTAADGAYTAVVTLDKTEGMLQGMTAAVDVRIQGVENALIIPVDALHKTSTGAYVYTSYDEQMQQYGGRVDVTTGLSNDNYVEITSGLQAGDTVFYTESRSMFDMFPGMGGMGNMGGGRGSQSGGMPGGGMPSGGMPSGGMPGGGMPGGGMPGGGMPGGRG